MTDPHLMSRVELNGDVVELVGEEVPIAIHRDVDVRAAEVVLDRVRVNTTTDEHGRARVSEIVDLCLTGSTGTRSPRWRCAPTLALSCSASRRDSGAALLSCSVTRPSATPYWSG